MNGIHEDDYSAIGTQHEQVTGRINDLLIELQNHAYATGVERGKELAKQAAIEAGTISPTLCQTIHLGQPGVTVEPCLMLGPADDEVACLLFTAPGNEVRLTWPTQTQALAVLAAATGEQALPPAVPLADKHHGMRISAGGVLRRVKGDLKFGAITLLEHLEQMAELFYSGDLTAVDTFLQLYDLDEKRPQQQAPTSAEVQHEP
ncbi:hypothetical protein [Halopseudomonas aestusnigri]|uniref:hypothetical protein n=1 Tax=Halopseudomonas aestusnigri TaxID=857252 RepID=UPI003002FC07